MTFDVQTPLAIGGERLEPGRYGVEIDESDETVVITKDGGEIARAAPTVVRPSKAAVNEPTAQLRQVKGEPRMLLVVRTPPATEVVLSLDEAQ